MTNDESPPFISETSKHSLDQRPESPQRPSKFPKVNDDNIADAAGNDFVEEEEQKESMNPNPRLQRYLIAIEYIGTRFAGAQQQPNCRTVVGVLQEAFQKFVGQPVSVFCSSRTKQFKGGDKVLEEELKTNSADPTASLVSLTKNLSINSRPFKSSV